MCWGPEEHQQHDGPIFQMQSSVDRQHNFEREKMHVLLHFSANKRVCAYACEGGRSMCVNLVEISRKLRDLEVYRTKAVSSDGPMILRMVCQEISVYTLEGRIQIRVGDPPRSLRREQENTEGLVVVTTYTDS